MRITASIFIPIKVCINPSHVKETKINILVQETDRPIKDPPTLYFSETSYKVDLKTKMLPGKKLVQLSILQTDILQTRDSYVIQNLNENSFYVGLVGVAMYIISFDRLRTIRSFVWMS